MKNKVITMTDSNYFKYGTKLLQTRHIVDADFVCYGPDLEDDQIETLYKNNIIHKKINQDIWDKWMQSLKFQFIMDEIDETGGGITFVDWDTYFLKDWAEIFYRAKWDFGITVRQNLIDSGKTHRAWANGGVIFARNNYSAVVLCGTALNIIERGGIDITKPFRILPQYDKIWKTLEEGRKPEKTHYRTDKRWWCDQVFLSALIMACKHNQLKFENDINCRFKFFDCKQYNNMWEETPDTYIMHLKDKSGAPGNLKDGK